MPYHGEGVDPVALPRALQPFPRATFGLHADLGQRWASDGYELSYKINGYINFLM
jgi:hypothetical protein